MATILGRRGRGGPRPDDEGRMPLVEHLRELRSRLVKSVLALAAGFVAGLVLYPRLLALITRPFRQIPDIAAREGLDVTLNFDAITQPFTIPLQIALFFAIVAASPVWIYQLWAFITPGLHAHERRYASAVVLFATPLFVGGVVMGYLLLPKGLAVIIGFTPQGISNIVAFSGYLTFVLRLLFVFGVGFLLPVFVVLLNAVGVFSGARIARWRAWVVFGIFVFAAVATPTGDPVTMLLLATPMWLLFEAAVLICRVMDRRRARTSAEPDYDAIGDDETSALTAGPYDPDDDRPSRLDETT